MSVQLPPQSTVDTTARVLALRSQYPEGLIGVPRTGLRLTWRAEASSPQLGHQLRWAGAHDGVAEAVTGDASIAVPVPGPELEPGEERRYRVRIATALGWSEWSDELVVEATVDPAGLEALPTTPRPRSRPGSARPPSTGA